MCKHLAATLYGVGARLDEQPELLFLLRGVNYEELVDTELDVLTETGSKSTSRRIDTKDLGAIFDIDMDEAPRPRKKTTARKKVARKKPASGKSPARKRPFTATAASVKRLRKDFAMTLAEFASLAEVSQASIANWERQKGKLNLHQKSRDALEKVAKLTPSQARRKLNAKAHG